MTTKKPTATERIKALTEGKNVAVAENNKIIKSEEIFPKKIDRRKFNKAGPGAGRPPGGIALYKRELKKLLAEHFAEKIKVQVTDPKTGKTRIIDKPRVIIQIERLFKFGEQQYQPIDLWLNRAVGKSPQPIIGDEEEDPISVETGAERILRKLYDNETDG